LNDRRANKVYLTDLALEQEGKILELLQQWSSFLAEGIDEQSVTTMLTVLEEMVKKVEDIDFRERWRNE
jgi:hypothetical protein